MDFTCSESSKPFSSYAPEKQSTRSFLLFKTKMQSIFKQSGCFQVTVHAPQEPSVSALSAVHAKQAGLNPALLH